MAAQRELVALLPRNAEALRHPLRRQAHREIRIRVVVHQPWVQGNLVAAHRDHGHGLGAARQHDFRPARHDALGSHGNGLQARRAEAIDGHRRHFNWQPCPQRCDPGHVHPLLSFRHGAADDNVFNLLGIKLRYPRQRALDRDRSQFIWTGRAQRAFKRAAHRSTDGRNDDDFSHGELQQSL